nr:VCBS domain-containing protein [Comamonas aquatica]
MEVQDKDGNWVTINLVAGSTTSVAGQHGTLVVNADKSWTYTLAAASEHDKAAGKDTEKDENFAVRVTDSDNDVNTSASIDITIKDDGPKAEDDMNNVREGDTLSVDAENGVLHSDTAGADGWASGGGVVGVSQGANVAAGPDSNGNFTITTDYGTLTLKADGSYTYKATANAITANVPDVFTYTVRDADGDEKTAALTINIENTSGPTANADTSTIFESGTASGSNVVLILDRSGSMGPAGNNDGGSDPDGSGPYTSRMQMLKEAVANLFNSGAVHSVFIVSFASSATFHSSGQDGGWYTNLADAMAAIEQLNAGGTTSYKSALDTVRSNFSAPPQGGDKLVSIFMSDGKPSSALSTSGSSSDEQKWIDFLTNNEFDDSYAVGFGGLGSSDKTYLEPIAWHPGETRGGITVGENDPNVKVVDTSVSDLTNTLISSAGGNSITGNITDNDAHGTAPWSGDGWKLTTISYVDGSGVSQTYTFMSASDSTTIDIYAPSPATPGSMMQIGKLLVSANGEYRFTGQNNTDVADDISATVNYTVKDASGATASSTLTLTIQDRSEVSAADDNATVNLDSSTVTVAASSKPLANEFSSSDSNQWTFSNVVDRNTTANLATDGILSANLGQWQSTSWNSNSTLDAARSGSSSNRTLTLTDSNGSGNGDAQLVTPTYTTGNVAGETLQFQVTGVSNLGGANDSAGWKLYKSVDNGNGTMTWTEVQQGSITGTQTNPPIKTNALEANTTYRIVLTVHDGTGNTSSSKASVTFDNFQANIPSYQYTNWTTSPLNGLVKDNDSWGANGEASTLSVWNGTAWVNAATTGTTIMGEHGTLVIKSDGSYTYTPTKPDNGTDDVPYHQERFEYKVTQADGDTDSAFLNITIKTTGPGAVAELHGSVGDDVLIGSDGNDIIVGGAGDDALYGGKGNDTLTGGMGDDEFVWLLGDEGTVGTPAAEDTIMDFGTATNGMGQDVLVLNELLVGEEDETDLSQFLHVEKIGSDTVIQIHTHGLLDADGGNFNQSIVLKNVDLVNGAPIDTSADQNALIQQLIQQGKITMDGHN